METAIFNNQLAYLGAVRGANDPAGTMQWGPGTFPPAFFSFYRVLTTPQKAFKGPLRRPSKYKKGTSDFCKTTSSVIHDP